MVLSCTLTCTVQRALCNVHKCPRNCPYLYNVQYCELSLLVLSNVFYFTLLYLLCTCILTVTVCLLCTLPCAYFVLYYVLTFHFTTCFLCTQLWAYFVLYHVLTLYFTMCLLCTLLCTYFCTLLWSYLYSDMSVVEAFLRLSEAGVNMKSKTTRPCVGSSGSDQRSGSPPSLVQSNLWKNNEQYRKACE